MYSRWLIVIVIFLGVSSIIAFFSIRAEWRRNWSHPVASPTKSYSYPTASPIVAFGEVTETFKTFNADLKIRYFSVSPYKENMTLRIVDFKEGVNRSFVLPYIDKNESNEFKYGRYVVSPDNSYIAKITTKKLEVAQLVEGRAVTFTTVFTVPEMKGSSGIEGYDYAHMGDAMWDDKKNLYFTSEVGGNGVGNPYGVYSDLYIAQEDGSKKRLLNDHTKEGQEIGFMKSFAYIDSARGQLFFTGLTHRGHTWPLVAVNAKTGVVQKELTDIGHAVPVFNKDYSKAYYTTDDEEKGYDDVPHVKIAMYDMKSSKQKILYTVTNSTTSRNITMSNYLSGSVFLTGNKLFFEEEDNKTSHLYYIDVLKDGGPHIVFDTTTCSPMGAAGEGRYLLLECSEFSTHVNRYEVLDLEKGLRSIILLEQSAREYEKAIRIIDFK